MAKQINVGEIQSGLNVFRDGSNTCQNLMSNINSGYVQGTQAEWSSPKADEWMTSFENAFNDYIRQWNTNYSQGAQEFVDAANNLLMHENANTVNVEVQQISEFSKGWTGNADSFNIPDDYAGFTSEHLDAPLQQMISTLQEMQNGIQRAVEGGLAGEHCTNVRESLGRLSQSAQDVANEYNSSAANTSVNQDEYISTHKANS